MRIRRGAGFLMAVAMGVGSMQGQQTNGVASPKTMLLWPAGAPGAQGDEEIDKPTLTVYLPAGVNATKTGVVVAPGGGYVHLAMEKEGTAIAAWLNARGVA